VALFVSLAIASTTAKKTRLRLATTTSTDNTGLLNFILPDFEKRFNIKTDVIPVGTGKALKLAERGDVDVVIVHAPEAEAVFMEAGFGVNRRAVMINQFLIAGTPSDPAGLKKAKTLTDALKKIKRSNSVFFSRGDDSGTHKKELKLWAIVGGPPPKNNYFETGQGMEATLRIAREKEGYTLTDRGTFLAIGKPLGLIAAFEGNPLLENPYSIIAVNPSRHPHARYMEAMMFIAWITSPKVQALIGSFKKEGEVLFHPTAVPQEKKN